MNRTRVFCAILIAVFALSTGTAFAQEDMSGSDGPAVVLDDGPEALEEEAWTFRFLVPTLLLVTAIAVPLVIVGYGIRVRARYRVTQ
jgi:hypothetical protein